MFRKGFTLVELMIVILIVAILAAVAIPLMTGRLDAAKWSEARAAMGTIATSVRAYYAERGCTDNAGAPTAMPALYAADATNPGINATDLDGTYFDNPCYAIANAGCNAAGQVTFDITCNAGASTRGNAPISLPLLRHLRTAVDGSAAFDF
jgi:prepilin-type N-terminal cleavage/methylation domain-containing protein